MDLPPDSASNASSIDRYKYDAFISYSQDDRPWVNSTLLPTLERRRLRVCIDYRNFEIGVPGLVNVENAVRYSRKTLLVLTPAWVASQWTGFEALLVQTEDPAGRGQRMLPLLVRPCELPGRLQIFTYLDLTDASILPEQMQRLVAAIESTTPSTTTARSDSQQAQQREPAYPARLSGVSFGHERGLAAMSRLFEHIDIDTQLDFSVLQSRLFDNLRDERLFGSSEAIRSDRARIVLELNRLALTHIGKSYNALCRE